MRRSQVILSGLLLSTALSSAAFAQGGAAPGGASSGRPQQNEAGQLEEIIVTATRQSASVNRVPLSITAMTQDTLERQNIRSAADLQQSVPALNVSGQTAGVQNFTIRGILATSGAATTGVYLDDTPLQRRFSNGVSQNNGTPAPTLFDLERVEVLRGPQGTLYGGSSQGGTLRFITPAPSLTTYSGRARAEVSHVEGGEEGYELGVAVGGPIVQDKLGFRVSAYHRELAGYVDMIDMYNGALRYKDANSRTDQSLRAAVVFAPTERSRFTAAYFWSLQRDEGGSAASSFDVNNGTTTYTTAEACFDTRRGVTSPTAITAVACPAREAQPSYLFRREARTYGPFNFLGEGKSIQYEKTPARTELQVANLTYDHDFDALTMKSVTSYIHDRTSSIGYEFNQVTAQRRLVGYAAQNSTGFNQWIDFPNYPLINEPESRRYGVTQEIRFASPADARPLSWVVGAYYSNIRTTSEYAYVGASSRQQALLFGIRPEQRYSQRNPDGTVTGLPAPFGTWHGGLTGELLTTRYQTLKDVEIAGFGETNLWLTKQLKATAGVRISRVSFDYTQTFYGPASGWNVPTVANGGVVSGSVVQAPVTPKLGLTYEMTPSSLIYTTVSKGFRAGGVNSPISESICGAGLANVGLTVNDVPKEFGSDSVWSYEVGGKFRLFNGRVQLNTSAYSIDWSGVQLNVSIPGCGQTWTENAGKARSQGFDVQAESRVGPFTFNVSGGLTDAKYVETSLGPDPAGPVLPTPIVRKGDTFPIPKWQFTIGAQYDFRILALPAFVRADYQFQGKYFRTPGPGVNQYSPDTRNAPSTDLLNLRAGLDLGDLNLEAFVSNVLNSQDELGRTANRQGCSLNTTTGEQDPACPVYVTFNPLHSVTFQRPREFGVRALYRF